MLGPLGAAAASLALDQRHLDQRAVGVVAYRLVRHPLYLGMIVGLWSAPALSAGHLLLAAGMTAYIVVAIRHEERDLVRQFGDAYRGYQARVRKLVPVPRREVGP